MAHITHVVPTLRILLVAFGLVASGALIVGCEGPTKSSSTPVSVQLSLRPSALPVQGGDVEITATVLSGSSKPLGGVQLQFSSTAGTISPAAPVATDASGVAVARLSTSQPATVTAAVVAATASGAAPQPSGVSGQINVPLKAPAEITITASSQEVLAGKAIDFEVGLKRAGADATGSLTMDLGDGTVREMGQVTGRATLNHTYQRSGGVEVRATFAESDGSRSDGALRLDVRSSSGDDFDIRKAIVVGPNAGDVADWAATSQVLSVAITGGEICIRHTKAGQWPIVPYYGAELETNFWIFAQINGQWYGGTFSNVRPGQTCKAMTAGELGDHVKGAPMSSWRPRAGEPVALMASAPARFEFRSVRERSNVVVTTWPY